MSNVFGAMKYFSSGISIFDTICDLIIRPQRARYDPKDDLAPHIFCVEGEEGIFVHEEITLENMRGMKVKCSWFHHEERQRQPCVVYLHGNCGSRCDSLEAFVLLRHGFSLFAFDATGSGESDGELISLGFYERQDLAAVIDFLSSKDDVDGIGLWGRSMGAVTSIMYSAKDSSIKCIVCDSPFSSLRQLINDLVKQHGSKRIPLRVVEKVVNHIRKRIVQRAAFDIDDLNALKYAAECVVPTFIFHGENDTFVKPEHSLVVCNAFKGSCLHHLVKGGHNDERGDDVLKTIIEFFTLHLILKPQGLREQRESQRSLATAGLEGAGEMSCEVKDGDVETEKKKMLAGARDSDDEEGAEEENVAVLNEEGEEEEEDVMFV